jgi:hypothetical protein
LVAGREATEAQKKIRLGEMVLRRAGTLAQEQNKNLTCWPELPGVETAFGTLPIADSDKHMNFLRTLKKRKAKAARAIEGQRNLTWQRMGQSKDLLRKNAALKKC